MTDSELTFLKPGQTCSSVYSAGSFEFLIDAAAYYQSLVRAARQAENQICILSWDIDSRLKLNRESEIENPGSYKQTPQPIENMEPVTLLGFFNNLLKNKPGLNIYILSWDYSVIYALEREKMTALKWDWQTEKRLRFVFDSSHPAGASHHQKVVVIDDRIAFIGGIDLTAQRWDTPDHTPDHPGRIRPDGESYPPFHDAQIKVTGQLAKQAGNLFRSRWQQSTGEKLPEVATGGAHKETDNDGLKGSLIRTMPEYKNRKAVFETEEFFRKVILEAKDYIYIENQYLTSSIIKDALLNSLQKESGPELILVLPLKCPDWLEETTMGVIRSRILEELFSAKHSERLHMYYPVNDNTPVYVHAKLIIADDKLAMIGSANLSNRSLRLDTECGVAVESRKKAPEIQNLLVRLLAEHTGSAEKAVLDSLSAQSIVNTIGQFKDGPRKLIELESEVPEWLKEWMPDSENIDPPGPYDF